LALFEKFGEMDSAEELIKAAEGLSMFTFGRRVKIIPIYVITKIISAIVSVFIVKNFRKITAFLLYFLEIFLFSKKIVILNFDLQ
jgi:hypothetical protein